MSEAPAVPPSVERRLKIVSMQSQFMVSVFNWHRHPPSFFALPVTNELPSDCYVVSVNANWNRNTIDLLVASQAFEIVADGQEPPRVDIQEMRIVPFSEISNTVPMHIFDAYKKAVDAWDSWLENYHDDYEKVAQLVKAARQAGESVK